MDGAGSEGRSESKADVIRKESKTLAGVSNKGENTNFVGQTMSGDTWYAQSASRAVNQAIGRIIRHRNDWGAIFLMDDRFEKPNQHKQLSSWVRCHMQKFSDYRKCMQSFRSFLTNNCPLKAPDKGEEESKVADTDLEDMFFAPLPLPNKVDFAKRDREKEAATSTLGNKKVTVRVAKLPAPASNEDDGLSFINPDLFLSQREPGSAVKAVANKANNATAVVRPDPEPVKKKQLSMSEGLRLKKQEQLIKPVEESSFTTMSRDSATISSSSFRLNVKNVQAATSAPKKPFVSGKAASTSTNPNVFGLSGSMPWTSMEEVKSKKVKTAPSAPTSTAALKNPKASKAGALGQSKLNFPKKRTATIKDESEGMEKRPKPTSPGSDPFDIENLVMGHQTREGGSTTISAANANASVTCVICKEENPPDICAAKECGHLCCKVCWVNWLKMRQICPLCKIPVSEESIRGIMFK